MMFFSLMMFLSTLNAIVSNNERSIRPDSFILISPVEIKSIKLLNIRRVPFESVFFEEIRFIGYDRELFKNFLMKRNYVPELCKIYNVEIRNLDLTNEQISSFYLDIDTTASYKFTSGFLEDKDYGDIEKMFDGHYIVKSCPLLFKTDKFVCVLLRYP